MKVVRCRTKATWSFRLGSQRQLETKLTTSLFIYYFIYFSFVPLSRHRNLEVGLFLKTMHAIPVENWAHWGQPHMSQMKGCWDILGPWLCRLVLISNLEEWLKATQILPHKGCILSANSLDYRNYISKESWNGPEYALQESGNGLILGKIQMIFWIVKGGIVL